MWFPLTSGVVAITRNLCPIDTETDFLYNEMVTESLIRLLYNRYNLSPTYLFLLRTGGGRVGANTNISFEALGNEYLASLKNAADQLGAGQLGILGKQKPPNPFGLDG